MDFDIEFISLDEFIDIIKKNWRLITIIPLITTLISFIFTFYLIEPKYSVYTKVFIGKQESQNHQENYNNDDVEMYLKLLKTYSEVVKTNKLVSNALQEYNIDLTSSDVLKHLSCIPMADTQILEIKYEDSDRDEARRVVTAITNEFVHTAEDLIPNGRVRIVENVVVPLSPSKPNQKLNLVIGLMSGLIIGFGIVFLKEFFDSTFKSKEKLRRIVGIPVLGVIPDESHISRRARSSKRRSKINNKLIMESASTSIVSEAYRTLQTNIKYSSSKKIHTLLITSSQFQEGKSTVVGNLALGFSEENIKIIVIDCDIRIPTLHKKFGLANDIGLSEVIQNKVSLEKAVQKYNDNLYILTSGRTADNPASMFSSDEMNSLIDTLKNTYDLVIFDSAPVLAVTDAQILSTKVDATLIVVRYALSKIPAVLECKSLLTMVTNNLIGTILHGVELNKDNDYRSTSVETAAK